MTRVQLIKNWDFPDWRQMSPGGRGVWGDITITEDAIDDPDYVLALNQPSQGIDVIAPPNRIWALIQEPPTPYHAYLHRGQRGFARIYTSDVELAARSQRHVASYPALAWHVQRSFDALTQADPIPPKSRDVSWITSSLSFLPGHKKRMELVEAVRGWSGIDVYGKGINFIDDKWDGLAPYRYAMVFENHIGPHYWSEKLVDCFLAGAMPIYVGCSNLEEYFPAASFIRFDPLADDPISRLEEIVASTRAEDNREALIEARRRCLYELQFFPFIAKQIAQNKTPPLERQRVALRNKQLLHPIYRSKAFWHWKIKPMLVSK